MRAFCTRFSTKLSGFWLINGNFWGTGEACCDAPPLLRGAPTIENRKVDQWRNFRRFALTPPHSNFRRGWRLQPLTAEFSRAPAYTPDVLAAGRGKMGSLGTHRGNFGNRNCCMATITTYPAITRTAHAVMADAM